MLPPDDLAPLMKQFQFSLDEPVAAFHAEDMEGSRSDQMLLFFFVRSALKEADAIHRSYVYVDELACSNDMTGEL